MSLQVQYEIPLQYDLIVAQIHVIESSEIITVFVTSHSNEQ
jgi:hypothetical protein